MMILKPGMKVVTVEPEQVSNDWTAEALEARRWDMSGTILKEHNGHGLCYTVEHDDGTVGSYEPRELERYRTIAVYGGSFSPPHIGHAMVIQWILWTGHADEVLIVPSAAHPHGKTHAPFELRAELLEAMAQDLTHLSGEGVRSQDSPVRVSWVEEQLAEVNTPVYTYDLLTHLKAKQPDVNFRFVIGADILGQTDRWHLWDKVKAEFNLIALGREGYPSPDGAPIIPDFSSSVIRKYLRYHTGTAWESMVTPRVRALLWDDEVRKVFRDLVVAEERAKQEAARG